MADLTLDKASLGYDRGKIATALKNINYEVIDTSIRTMDTELQTLLNAVDAVWQGKSADAFKKNMKTDETNICQGLNDIRDALIDEFAVIVKAMATIDANLVENRGGSN